MKLFNKNYLQLQNRAVNCNNNNTNKSLNFIQKSFAIQWILQSCTVTEDFNQC